MKTIQYIAFTSVLFFFMACNSDFFTPVVDINLPPHKSKLVVFANLRAETDSLVVHLTRTRSALDTAQAYIIVNDTVKFGNGQMYVNRNYIYGDTLKDAKVELYRNDILWGTFKANSKGQYILRKKLIADDAVYKIRAEATGYDVVEASQKMPSISKIDSVRFVKDGAIIQDFLSTYKEDEFTYFFKDPIEAGNYFAVQAEYKNSQTANNNYPQFIYLQSLDKLAQSGFLNDKSFNGKAYSWRHHGKLYDEPRKGDRIIYTLFTTNVDLFQFIRSKELNEEVRNNPFAEPTVLFSNIKNGYGVFSLSTISTWVKQF